MRFLVILGVVLCSSAAWAQGTPLTVSGELRYFGGREGLTYLGLQAERGSWILRGVAADKKTAVLSEQASVQHGGWDVEAAYRRQLSPEWQGQLGLSYSDTAARSKKVLVTARARWEQDRYFIEPRAILNNGTWVGVAFGASTLVLKNSATVSATVTPMFGGRNAFESDGKPARRTLWELGISRDRVTVGATSALGATTSMSLTPSIGPAGYFVKVRLTP
ncbi:MAG: hypothetical protein QM758_17725 [Armatimonas sp.]